MNGLVSDIQQFSVNDGYGIRTIVFLAGCSMRCAWCQNPETIDGKPALMFNAALCGGCGVCVKECPTGGACIRDGQISVDKSRCAACLGCVEHCYYGARKASCTTMGAGEVFDAVMRDEVFFRQTGGGLTVSGGEPFCQSAFTAELLRLAKSAGIHTAVETAGNVPYPALMAAIPYTDLFLYDLKAIDDQIHRRWTQVSNKQILQNFERLCRTKIEVIVRVPLLPGINDGRAFDAIVDYAASFGHLTELHILPYHTLGSDKYTHLGMPYPLGGLREENSPEIARCKRYAQAKGFRVSVGGAGF